MSQHSGDRESSKVADPCKYSGRKGRYGAEKEGERGRVGERKKAIKKILKAHRKGKRGEKELTDKKLKAHRTCKGRGVFRIKVRQTR